MPFVQSSNLRGYPSVLYTVSKERSNVLEFMLEKDWHEALSGFFFSNGREGVKFLRCL